MKRGKKALLAAGEIYTEPDDQVFLDQFGHVFLCGIFPGLSQESPSGSGLYILYSQYLTHSMLYFPVFYSLLTHQVL